MDNTQASTFQSCQERYRLNYGLQLRKRRDGYESDNLAMPWGSCVHTGLEAHYSGKDNMEIARAIDQDYQVPVPDDEKLYTLDNAHTLLLQYPEWAKHNDQGQEILATELYGQIDLGPGYKPFECIIDTVVRRESGIWSLEHKTTGKQLSSYWWGKFEPSTQVTAQTAYIQQEFGQCSGVIINALSVAYLTKPKLLDPGDPEINEYSETHTAYSKYYKADKVYCSGFRWQGARQIFNRTPDQIEDFKQNIRRVYDRLGDTIDRYGWQVPWEKNESNCYFCEYKDICNSLADPSIIDIMYEQYDAYEYINNRRQEAQTNGRK